MLDAGCGSGRVTRLLVERLPQGKVIAVDASPSMVEMVRDVLRPQDEALLANLTELELDRAGRRDLLQRHLPLGARPRPAVPAAHAALRPGGQLEAQCGGEGNVAEFERAIEASAATSASHRTCAGSCTRGTSPASGRRRCASSAPASRPFAVARAKALSAARPARLPARLGPRVPPRPPARGPARAVRGRGGRLDAAPAGARLRAAQHLGAAAVTRDPGSDSPAARGRDRPGDRRGGAPAAGGDRRVRVRGARSWAAPRSTPTVTALTDEVLEACRGSDAVLLGAVGGPKWDTTDPDAPRPEQGLLGLRQGLGLYANLRPVRPSPALVDCQPAARGADRRHRPAGGARADRRDLLRRQRTRRRSRPRHLRVLGRRDRADRAGRLRGGARRGRRAARRRASTSVDKANVLETSRLWRETVARRRGRLRRGRARAPAGRQRRDAARLRARPGSTSPDREHVRRHPLRRGSDAHRLARDAAVGEPGRDGPGLFEPVHGSAPDIAGRGSPIRWRPSSRWR